MDECKKRRDERRLNQQKEKEEKIESNKEEFKDARENNEN